MYYNTTNETGETLRESNRRATKQEDIILSYFEKSTKGLSPSQVEIIARNTGNFWPITSIRRAICDLTVKGKLVKTDSKRVGKYSKCEHIWLAA